MPLEQKTEHKRSPVALLDGGTGEEIFRLGVPDDRGIWSARALVEPRYHPIVRRAHMSFIVAGARTITTNNYAVTPGVGLSNRLEELTELAARLASEARDEAGTLGHTGVRICGSLPPLIESYRPDLVLPHDRAADHYERIGRSLGQSADIFLAETMSSIAESIAAAHGARRADREKPLWVSWTLRSDGRLRSGEEVTEAVDRLLDEGAQALLFNCSEPEAIVLALSQLHRDPARLHRIRSLGAALGAYANRLTPVPEDFEIAQTTAPQPFRSDLGPERYLAYAKRWVELGATLVGGCCGVGPDIIALLHKELVAPGPEAGGFEAMNAIEYDREQGLRLVTRPLPPIGDEDVLVEVLRAGICGSDLHILEGRSLYADRVILGHEAVGRVAERGPRVPATIAVGDRVSLSPQYACGACSECRKGRPNFCEEGGYSSTLGYYRDGCFARYVVAHASQIHRIPGDLDLETAVLAEPFNCLINGWKKLRKPPAGSRILILGAGLFGLLWASLLHYHGYRDILITEPLPGRLRLAASLCATKLTGCRAKAPSELTDADTFDVIVEACGAADAIADGYKRLHPGGRLLVFGGPPKGSTITIDPSDLLFKELTLCGSMIGQNTFAEGLSTLAAMAQRGYLDLERLGVKEFALSSYSEAFTAAREGSVARAVLVLEGAESA